MKLKTQWRKLSGAVYENKNGTRIHVHGFIMFKGKKPINIGFNEMLIKRAKIMGGRQKRGLMLLAENLEEMEISK